MSPGIVPEDVAGLDDDRITAFGILHEAHERLVRCFEATLERECGLGGSEFEVLLRVGRSPEQRLSMSELAHQLLLTSGGTTRLVDRVVALGLVERTACPTDRRVQHVVLTDAGREKLADALRVHLPDLQAQLVERLDPEELASLTRALDKLRNG